jgi:ABC-2 type transport system ATP-binding protein
MSEEPAIEAAGLVKHYGKTRALDGLDLTVPTGTVYGLLGPNGAGKTTCVRVLSTLIKPDSGYARVFGNDVVAHAQSVRNTIGLTGQYAALDEYLTGRANLIMIGQLSRLTARAAKRRTDELLERFGLTKAANRAVKTYSGGMRRRLDLAASLISHPRMLFLDEPTTGLDPSARALMWEIVRQLVADGTTLLLTTQYLDEADQLANRIAVIDTGKVIAEGTPAELKASLGGQRLLLTLADESDAGAAAQALAPFATSPISLNDPSRVLEIPVISSDGLATEVVRALDAAGVKVRDIAVRTASLDDVFLTLTGHLAEDKRAEEKRSEDKRAEDKAAGEKPAEADEEEEIPA